MQSFHGPFGQKRVGQKYSRSPFGPFPPFARLTLARQFIVVASLVLGLAMVLLGSWMNNRIRAGVLKTSAQSASLYMENFLGPHIQSLAEGKPLSKVDVQALNKISFDLNLRRHIVSIKIWRPDGLVTYSYPSQLAGKSFETDEIAPALKGKVVGFYKKLGEDENAFERSLKLPLYEIYSPLYEAGTGRVIAVGEFYANATKLDEEILTARVDTWAVVGITFLAMAAVLFVIVNRGSETIERQKRDLEREVEEQLQLRLANDRLHASMADAQREIARVDELLQRRVGSDLHDGPAQLLTLILLRLEEVETALAEVPEPSADAIRTAGDIREAARQALEEIREISRGLFMPQFDRAAHLRDVIAETVAVHERRTGTTVRLELGELPDRPGLETVRCTARIIQEALTNAYKHAGGRGQAVEVSESGGFLSIRVSDRGGGMPASSPETDAFPRRLGLLGMRSRAQAQGGDISITSTDRGTTITCTIPAGDPARATTLE